MDSSNVYAIKPEGLLTQLSYEIATIPATGLYSAGFELGVWRCDALADHLIEWMVDYALHEEDLSVNHGNMYVRLKQAAARIYTSKHYERRGEIGEIAMHAICRQFFNTIPLAPRVFYLTSSNEVVKSFDLVHVRYFETTPELWLGEAKFYENGVNGAKAAVKSLSDHLTVDFLHGEKLILGPQVSRNVPRYQEIRHILSDKTSLDNLFETAIFPICIASDSAATVSADSICEEYLKSLKLEIQEMSQIIAKSELPKKVRLVLLHLPLGSKQKLATAFDKRLRGLLP